MNWICASCGNESRVSISGAEVCDVCEGNEFCDPEPPDQEWRDALNRAFGGE